VFIVNKTLPEYRILSYNVLSHHPSWHTHDVLIQRLSNHPFPSARFDRYWNLPSKYD
jgi:hypothetical protein